MQPIIINNKSYFLCTDLFEHHKNDFNGCKGRDVIKKKKLKVEDYIYAYNSKVGWKVSTEDYAKAKVLVSVQWYQQSYESIELNNTLELSDNISSRLMSDSSSLSNHSISTTNKYPIAPEILDIEENEKFKDSNGRTLDITIRGERNHRHCYFRLKDIVEGFEMPNLQKIIQNENTSYELNIHYKFFTIVYGNNVSTISITNDSKNEIYLTYKGVLKVLFSSRSGNAESFQDWVIY